MQPSQIAQPVSSSVVPEPLPRPRSSPSRGPSWLSNVYSEQMADFRVTLQKPVLEPHRPHLLVRSRPLVSDHPIYQSRPSRTSLGGTFVSRTRQAAMMRFRVASLKRSSLQPKSAYCLASPSRCSTKRTPRNATTTTMMKTTTTTSSNTSDHRLTTIELPTRCLFLDVATVYVES